LTNNLLVRFKIKATILTRFQSPRLVTWVIRNVKKYGQLPTSHLHQAQVMRPLALTPVHLHQLPLTTNVWPVTDQNFHYETEMDLILHLTTGWMTNWPQLNTSHTQDDPTETVTIPVMPMHILMLKLLQNKPHWKRHC